MNVLFITDGSISNPILQSQGIPQIILNSREGIQYFILSFESNLEVSPNKKKFFNSSFEKLKNYADLFQVKINFEFKPFRYFSILVFGALKTLKIVREKNIELIHCRSNFPTLIGLFVKLFTGVKVIFDNRGILSEEVTNNQINLRANFEKINEKVCIKYSDKIVVVSEKFREYLLNKNSKFRSKLSDKIEVINNGFDINRISFYESLRIEQRLKNKISERVVMVYSGTIVKWQKFDIIAEIFKIFKSIENNAYFLILTPDADDALKIMHEKEINEEDFLIKTAFGDELGKFLILGDFGILIREPNVINKVSSPIKFSEYLAAGLPVFISEGIGDTKQFISEYQVGVLTEYDNAKSYLNSLQKILNLLSDQSIHKKCAEIAKNNLSINKSAASYKKLYIQLINT